MEEVELMLWEDEYLLGHLEKVFVVIVCFCLFSWGWEALNGGWWPYGEHVGVEIHTEWQEACELKSSVET